jgi:hypothetical protein
MIYEVTTEIYVSYCKLQAILTEGVGVNLISPKLVPRESAVPFHSPLSTRELFDKHIILRSSTYRDCQCGTSSQNWQVS